MSLLGKPTREQLPALGVDCGTGGGLAALKAAFVCTEEPADDEDVVGELLAGLERATTKRAEPLCSRTCRADP